jgi:hypothetical protein
VTEAIWSDEDWLVKPGTLAKGPGRPPTTNHIFEYIVEKLPFASLNKVRNEILKSEKKPPQGVYLAHDSMGVARYGGRGAIFSRLATHKRDYQKELQFFSFYVIANKAHEREIETVILRAAGSQMTLNTEKVAFGLHPGNIADYEPGTHFFERQSVRGRRAKTRKKKNSN